MEKKRRYITATRADVRAPKAWHQADVRSNVRIAWPCGSGPSAHDDKTVIRPAIMKPESRPMIIPLVVSPANPRHVPAMRKSRSDRYDYAFNLIAVIFTFAFLTFANRQGWSVGFSLILLVVMSVPVASHSLGLSIVFRRDRGTSADDLLRSFDYGIGAY